MLKTKELEKSFAEELVKLQEKIDSVKESSGKTIEGLRTENEKYKEDLKYYREDNDKLVEDLQELRNQLKEKSARISKLYEIFGVKVESPSDGDLERQATHIKQLEKDLQDYIEQNEGLKERNRDLEDKKDEMTEEIENLKLQIVEEKRKRQRQRNRSVSQSSIQKAEGGKKQRERKKLPTPVAQKENTSSEAIDYESADGEGSTDEDVKAVSSMSRYCNLLYYVKLTRC